MEKTISINLGGTLFYAEEDAYQRLQTYLREVKHYFDAKGDDSGEILRDIEASLAEQFNNAGAGALQRAVTFKEVERALKNMGTVADFFAEEKNSADPNSNSGERDLPKRFYRDGDNVVVGGVCSGLGYYFGIDPVWVRLLFAASIFFWGFGVWIYIILWLVAPTAKTTAQKLSMQGEAVNLSSLSNKIKDNLSSPQLREAGSGAVLALSNFLKKFFDLIGRIIKGVGPLLRVLISLFLIFFSFIGLGVFSLSGAIAIFSGRQFLEPGLVAAIGWIYPWLLLSATLTLALPCLAVILLGVALLRRRNFLPSSFWFIFLLIWFASFLSAGALSGSAYASVRPYLTTTESRVIEVSGPVSALRLRGHYYVQLVPGDQLSLQAVGHPADLNNIWATISEGQLTIENMPTQDWLCFNCGHPVNLVLTMPAPLLKIEVADGAVLNLDNWQQDNLELFFSGFSGGNLAVNLQELNLHATDGADIDFVGGQVKLLKLEATDFVRINSGNMTLESVEASLAGTAQVSVRADQSLDVNFAPDAPGARLFYNPDLPVVTVATSSLFQLHFLGQEKEPLVTTVLVSSSTPTVEVQVD